MESARARPWEMAGYDLRALRGEAVPVSLGREEAAGSVQVWLLVERPAGEDPEIGGAPFPVGNGYRRESIAVVGESPLRALPPEPVTAAQLAGGTAAWLTGNAFGVNGGGYGIKTLVLNGKPAGALPECGDQWTPFRIRLEALPGMENLVEVRHPESGDSYKVGGLRILVELADGRTVKSEASAVYTSVGDWSFREGTVFKNRRRKWRNPARVFPRNSHQQQWTIPFPYHGISRSGRPTSCRCSGSASGTSTTPIG